MINNAYYSQQRRDVLDMINIPPVQALDVGCGEGHFGKLLHDKFGTLVTGIEPDPRAANAAQNNLDVCHCGTWEDLSGEISNKYDAIFFNDCLEHMIDPETALKSAASKLKPDGLIYASVPNFLYIDNVVKLLCTRDWRYEKSGILDITHIRFFTRKSIVRLFLNAGYTVQDIRFLTLNDTWKWRLLNRILFGTVTDFLIYQYGIVACRNNQE